MTVDTQRQSPEDIRQAQKRHWSSVAGAWARWLDWTEQNFAPLTSWLRDRTRWDPGTDLLDIGCGSGYPALAAAAAVRPRGKVVGIDVSPQMIAVSAQRAAAAGIDNIEFHEMDAETLRFPDETFDAVTCVCALMFSPDPQRAIGEIRRVLRRQGRFGIVVWDEPSLNPFSMVILGVMRRFISLPPLPGPTEPGTFRFAAPGTLESMLQAGGFSAFRIENCSMTFEFGSVDEYLQVVSEVTGWNRRVADLAADDISQFRQSLAETVEPYIGDGRVRLGASVRCAFGSK